MVKKHKHNNFAVLGLGRFGMSVVQTLAEYDVNILACDRDEQKLQKAASYATHVVQLDLADEYALNRLGLGNFDVVIIAMGAEFEATQIAAMVAKEGGASRVIAKARTYRQKKLLENTGADEVILPEHEIGTKLAHRLVGYNILDILGESDLYSISEMYPLTEWVGQTIRTADIRNKHHLTILAIRRGGRLILPVSPEERIEPEDVMVTLSEKKHVGN